MARKRRKKKVKSYLKVTAIISCFLLLAIFRLFDYFEIITYRSISQVVGLYDETVSYDSDATTVHFIDVGQGQCVLICSDGHNMLIDAGERDYSSEVIRYIENLDIEKFDYIIATHPHSDHIGGLSDVIEHFEVDEIIAPVIPDSLIPTSNSYYNFLNSVKKNGKGMTKAVVGDIYNLGSSQFEIIAPLSDKSEDLNNYSVVCVFRYGQNTALFGGDASESEENDILETGADINVDLLNVFHHGSSSSSGKEFLYAVSPKYCVIMCGADNSYGHPNKSTIERLEVYTDNIYRTDLQGTIVCEMDGNGNYRFFSEKE
ncbi:MAG: MBL fold metallo-hydrolase [Oscillospiraceae bacterium]|nr:MBL fold metallo-hydrolase [Oscillospiraceae bacterium]